MEFLWALGGLAVGFAAATLWSNRQRALLTEQLNNQLRDRSRWEGESAHLTQQLHNLQADLKAAQADGLEKSTLLATREERLTNLEVRLAEERAHAAEFKVKFEAEFKVLAQEILEKNTQTFSHQHHEKLLEILQPFRQKISEFEQEVKEKYDLELREKLALKHEISQLVTQNQTLSNEAKNLTEALKGSVKTQGNWGEFILESILEKSGLVKDREYFAQVSLDGEEGRKLQPDVLIALPDDKKVIIDSKVSLVAYDRLVQARDEAEQEQALRELNLSLRNHFKGLSAKEYQKNITGGLDFVLLFIPIEGAFAAALQNDSTLFNDAFERNVLLVSPSTLLASLRTIANIWKHEYQNRNTLKIAEEGAKLYDAFVRFTEDLSEVGKRLDKSREAYDQAFRRLTTGPGNLIKRTENMRLMGLKTSRKLNEQWLDESNPNEE
jgi:DNA recombination protein RmuC